ncbi:hypothetical protein [Cupriavidus sp. EM10]|uniref:hypothetical protein n=1 Tax=Cupriavidus sp. EM10 TaxID=2839983 RepID=UPI001C003BB4|nr:hypothetical protein [Cupriavidus sp. EM10]QWE96374.1 hypothetical protein KLP38_24625 [Cupriavidus sp. EM10]
MITVTARGVSSTVLAVRVALTVTLSNSWTCPATDAVPRHGQPSANTPPVEPISKMRRQVPRLLATMFSPIKDHPLARMIKSLQMIIICELFL